MAFRTVCLCEGKYIGIETIYTVVNGKQINIPEKIKELRLKSRNNLLFCPCGCGSNLILIAGDRGLREQHFRIKGGTSDKECSVVEGETSIFSKIVLKCWLDDKLKDKNIESRVPIHHVDDIQRKYEFTFLSREKKLALIYCHERVNLSDDKFEILESNQQGIKMLYVVDFCNSGTTGQYPERLMKVQDRQGYCLYLSTVRADYFKAKLTATVYLQDLDGEWKEISLAHGLIMDFVIDEEGNLSFQGEKIQDMLEKTKTKHFQEIEKEKARRKDEEERQVQALQRQIEKAEEERQRRREDAEKRTAELEKIQRNRERERQETLEILEEKLQKEMEKRFTQQETPIYDPLGNRWVQCKICGKITRESEFNFYGGRGMVNLGVCKKCSKNNPMAGEWETAPTTSKKRNINICPECGGTLQEKYGRNGKFMGCSNFPKCRYTRSL